MSIHYAYQYNLFQDWEALWLFMIRALGDDDLPPHLEAFISN